MVDLDPKIKNVVIEMLGVTSVDSVIRFCEENGIKGQCLELLKNEKKHCELSQSLFSSPQK